MLYDYSTSAVKRKALYRMSLILYEYPRIQILEEPTCCFIQVTVLQSRDEAEETREVALGQADGGGDL